MDWRKKLEEHINKFANESFSWKRDENVEPIDFITIGELTSEEISLFADELYELGLTEKPGSTIH